MATNYSVSLERILREFGFETLYLPSDASELYVTSQDVNRPGLLLAGRDDYLTRRACRSLVFPNWNS